MREQDQEIRSPPPPAPRVNGQRRRALMRNQQGFPPFSFVKSGAMVMNQEETKSHRCPSLGPLPCLLFLTQCSALIIDSPPS